MVEVVDVTASTWMPDERLMEELLVFFRTADRPDPITQHKLQVAAQSLRERADGMNYLVTIFSQYRGEHVTCRQIVGLFLKSILSGLTEGSISTDPVLLSSVNFVQKSVVVSLSDESEEIRNTAGIIVTTILTNLGCGKWPEVLELLCRYIRTAPLPVSRTSLDTLKKIVEDETDQDRVCSEKGVDSKFVEFSRTQFIPLLLELVQAPGAHPQMARGALETLDIYNRRRAFAYRRYGAEFFQAYWGLLGQVAVNDHLNAKILVLKAMSTICEYNCKIIVDNAPAVLEFFLSGSADPDYETRSVAISFWGEVVRDTTIHAQLKTLLPRLVPILVKNTVYTEHDYAAMDQTQLEEDNASIADMESMLVPRFHRGRGEGSDDDDEDGDDDAGDVTSAWGNSWTVRKSSAYALDLFCVTLKGSMLPHCLSLIEERLQTESSWEVQESGVLALGAISKGCLAELDPYVPGVLELLVRLSTNTKPLLRSICCWCLNRFSPWYCREDGHRAEYLSKALEALLTRMLDQNKCVQDAACSAVAGLEEIGRSRLLPYLGSLFECFNKALRLYQTKNLTILYDAIGTLAKMLGELLAMKNLVELDRGAAPRLTNASNSWKMLIEGLFAKWQKLKVGDYEAIALAECMGYVVQALGSELEPIIPIFITKTGQLMKDYIIKLREGPTGEAHTDFASTNALDCCLDLLSYILEASSRVFTPLFEEQRLMELVITACSDPAFATVMPLKQSAFALIGDLALHCCPVIRPYLRDLIPELATHLTASVPAVSSNASWSLGQIVENVPPDQIEPYVPFIIQQLADQIQENYSRSELFPENLCITLGRFSGHFPLVVAPHLPNLLGSWCDIMYRCTAEVERAHSFKGLAKSIILNPQAVNMHGASLQRMMNSFYQNKLDDVSQVRPRPAISPDLEHIIAGLRQWMSSGLQTISIQGNGAS